MGAGIAKEIATGTSTMEVSTTEARTTRKRTAPSIPI